MEDVGDGIISRSIGAIGKLKRVQSNRDGGANVALYKALKDLHDFRSLGLSQLEIPRVHTKQGESAFSYYAARSWKQLPEEIRCVKTLATFTLLNEHCATSELIALYFMYNHFLFNCFKFHFKSISISFENSLFLLFLISCFYCCE